MAKIYKLVNYAEFIIVHKNKTGFMKSHLIIFSFFKKATITCTSNSYWFYGDLGKLFPNYTS